MLCQFCSRDIKNKGSLKAHEMSCNDNPNKIKHKHSDKAGWPKGKPNHAKGKKVGAHPSWAIKFPNEKLFVENSLTARGVIKKRIINQKLIDYKCSICNIDPVWNGKPMPLILDHINGINNDNRLENLRFVCSNCDTQLDTYKSRNRRYASKVLKRS
jgi:hypothetical protein